MTVKSAPTKIVLHCTRGVPPHLEELVAGFIRNGVELVCVVGPDCRKVEDIIDELVVGDGSRDDFVATTSHPDESLADVIEFANTVGPVGDVNVVET
jgi:hypothetical protein